MRPRAVPACVLIMAYRSSATKIIGYWKLDKTKHQTIGPNSDIRTRDRRDRHDPARSSAPEQTPDVASAPVSANTRFSVDNAWPGRTLFFRLPDAPCFLAELSAGVSPF